MPLPLEGIRVISLGIGAVMPQMCQLMGEFGADVIKVESRLNVDFARSNGPGGYKDPETAPGWAEANRNKRGIAVNLKSQEGQQIVRRLIMMSDVVAENNRSHVVKGWGLDYDSVRQFKPDIIYISAQIFGRGGPYEDFQGFGPTAATFASFTYLWGHSDDPAPTGGPGAHPDFIAGKYGLIPVLAALDYRRRTGQGVYIDLSQAEVAAALMSERFLEYTINDLDPLPRGNRSPYAAPHGAYLCQGEDRYCVIAVQTDDHWRRFCRAIGSPPWTQDPKFATLLDRLRNVDELDELVQAWTSQHTPEEAMDLLQAEGVPAGFVQGGQDFKEDPQLRARGAFFELHRPVIGRRLYFRNPIRLSESPPPTVQRAPLLGEHTEEVCRDLLGMSGEEIRQLTEQKVIGY